MFEALLTRKQFNNFTVILRVVYKKSAKNHGAVLRASHPAGPTLPPPSCVLVRLRCTTMYVRVSVNTFTVYVYHHLHQRYQLLPPPAPRNPLFLETKQDVVQNAFYEYTSAVRMYKQHYY